MFRRAQPASADGSPFPSEAGAILTNIAPHAGIFEDLLPPAGSQVKLEIAPRALRPFPTLYDPQQDEPIVIVVPRLSEGTGNRVQGTGEESTLNPQPSALNLWSSA